MRLCVGLSVPTRQVGLLRVYRDIKACPYTHAHPLHHTQPSFPLNPVLSPPPSLSFLTFSTNLKVSFFERTNKLSLSLLVCGVTIQLSLFVGLQERREEGKAASPQAKPSFSLSPSSRPSCAKWGRTMLGTLSPHCCIATKPHSAVLGHAWKAWKRGAMDC